MITFTICLALAASYSRVSPETYFGDIRDDTLSVQQSYTKLDRHLYDVTLRFLRRRDSRIVASRNFEIGQSYDVPDSFCVGYFTQEERRQVFVSSTMGAVTTYLLDYDGGTIKKLYQGGVGRWYGEGGGRVHAYPTWDDQGHFAIREQFKAHTKFINGEEEHVDPYLVTRTIHISGT